MPAQPESYAIASGEVLSGGRFRLPAWRRAIAAGSWGEIPSTLLSSIDPKNDSALNPNHPSTAPWNSTASGIVNVPSVDGIMRPWCGGAWDDEDCRFWLPLGGGHGDSGDNAAYKIGLMQDAPIWSSPRPPSGALPLIAGGLPASATAQNASFLLDDGLETTGVYADGRPRAIHSYRKHIYVPGLGPVMVVQGGCFTDTSGSDINSWSLNETTGEWTRHDTSTNAQRGGTSGGAACYDSMRGCAYWCGAGTSRITRLDLDTWTFSALTASSFVASGDVALVYVPELDVIVYICGLFADKFRVVDPATGTIYQPGATGTVQAITGATGCAWVPGVGLVFEIGTGDLWKLAPTGNGKTTAWEWGQITVTGTPVTSTAVGTYTKFGYSAKLGGLYRFTSATTKPWFFATE